MVFTVLISPLMTHAPKWHPTLGRMLDLGGFTGAKDVIPAQAIQTGQKRFARMNPIRHEGHGHTVGNQIIDRVEQRTRLLGPGFIRRIDQHPQREAHAIGGPANLDDVVIGAVAGFVHGQVEVRGGHTGQDGADKRIVQLLHGEAQIPQNAAHLGRIAAGVGAKGGAVGNDLDQQGPGFKNAAHQLNKAAQDGGRKVGQVLAQPRIEE